MRRWSPLEDLKKVYAALLEQKQAVSNRSLLSTSLIQHVIHIWFFVLIIIDLSKYTLIATRIKALEPTFSEHNSNSLEDHWKVESEASVTNLEIETSIVLDSSQKRKVADEDDLSPAVDKRYKEYSEGEFSDAGQSPLGVEEEDIGVDTEIAMDASPLLVQNAVESVIQLEDDDDDDEEDEEFSANDGEEEEESYVDEGSAAHGDEDLEVDVNLQSYGDPSSEELSCDNDGSIDAESDDQN